MFLSINEESMKMLEESMKKPVDTNYLMTPEHLICRTNLLNLDRREYDKTRADKYHRRSYEQDLLAMVALSVIVWQ
jgi:hypothetical protein